MHSIILQALAQLTNHLLHEGYKEAQDEFAEVGNPTEVTQAIAAYKDLVNRNQFTGNERNIDWWRKQGWEAFSNVVSVKSQQRTKTQEKRSKSAGTSIFVTETPEWLVVVPLDKDASCYHGKTTDWCTTKPYARHFEDYFHTNDITLVYFLQLQTGDRWALAIYSGEDEESDTLPIECFTKNDTPISTTVFERQTGFKPTTIRQQVLADPIASQVQQSRGKFAQVNQDVQAAMPFGGNRDLSIEAKLWEVKNVRLMINYCTATKFRWDKLEKLLLSGVRSVTQGDITESAINYAVYVIGGKWLELEKVLVQLLEVDNIETKNYATLTTEAYMRRVPGVDIDKMLRVMFSTLMGTTKLMRPLQYAKEFNLLDKYMNIIIPGVALTPKVIENVVVRQNYVDANQLFAYVMKEIEAGNASVVPALASFAEIKREPSAKFEHLAIASLADDKLPIAQRTIIATSAITYKLIASKRTSWEELGVVLPNVTAQLHLPDSNDTQRDYFNALIRYCDKFPNTWTPGLEKAVRRWLQSVFESDNFFLKRSFEYKFLKLGENIPTIGVDSGRVSGLEETILSSINSDEESVDLMHEYAEMYVRGFLKPGEVWKEWEEYKRENPMDNLSTEGDDF